MQSHFFWFQNHWTFIGTGHYKCWGPLWETPDLQPSWNQPSPSIAILQPIIQNAQQITSVDLTNVAQTALIEKTTYINVGRKTNEAGVALGLREFWMSTYCRAFPETLFSLLYYYDILMLPHQLAVNVWNMIMPAMLNLSHAICEAITEQEASLLKQQNYTLFFLSKPVSFRGELSSVTLTKQDVCMHANGGESGGCWKKYQSSTSL